MPFTSYFEKCYFRIPLIINAIKLFSFPCNCLLKHGGVAQWGKTGTYSRKFHRIYYNVNKHCRINQLTKFYRHVAARCFQIQPWLGWHRERFTHGVLTSGQMRETYSFGTYWSISCNFFLNKISLPLSSTGKRERRTAAFSLWQRKEVFRLVYSRRKWGGKKSASGLCALRRASVIKRAKRTVRQSAVSHPTPHHSPLNSSCQPASSAVYAPGR